MTENGKSRRGFASMDREKAREIARKGGKAAHARGTAHRWTADEARAAGQKSGAIMATRREHLSQIGRLGGKKRAANRRAAQEVES